MEELPQISIGGVSFINQGKTSYQKSLCQNGKLENMQSTRAQQHLITSNRPSFSFNRSSSEIPNSPTNAMEFLCRSWSPSASDFLHSFSSSNLLLPPSIKDKTEDHDKNQVEVMKDPAPSRGAFTNKADSIRMDLNQMKGWLKGQSLTSFLRSRKEKRREELRFQTAKLHVALSVTRLAAAIASFATNGGSVAGDQHMGAAVASAAALVTTVWAETAESLGAPRAEVASAINTGLTIQTPMDMVALTATAATCLRGAAALESRAMTESNLVMSQEMLKVGDRICTILPSGHRECKWVTVHLKRKVLILSFRKKYLGGALTTSKEYKAIDVIEESNEGRGNFLLSLKTNKGIIKLVFQEEKQFTIWFSTITNLLQRYNLV